MSIKQCAVAGAWFGIFQALMPVAGYFIGSALSVYIEKFDHWITFGLLLIIGGNMIRESFSNFDTSGSNRLLKENIRP